MERIDFEDSVLIILFIAMLCMLQLCFLVFPLSGQSAPAWSGCHPLFKTLLP